jgi:anaerobic magnesium-protoporphyrin IX monomethyl ester cyclase
MSNESVLLVYPPSQWGYIDRFCQPLGALTLGSILRDAGIKVKVIDLSGEGWNPQQLYKHMKEENYTHVGATILTPFRDVGYGILKAAKKINPDVVTLAGGPHVSFFKEKVLTEYPGLDIAVSGEADLDIVDIIQNPTKKFYDLGCVEDIDNLPIPDRSHVRHIEYNELAGIYMDDSASMKWIRGCPWRKCRFCSRNELTLKHRRRSPEKIIEEIAIIQHELKYKNILVVDDSLALNTKFSKTILRMKIKEGLDIPFWALARVDQIDEEAFQLMKRANCSGLQVGIESIVPRVIDTYKKAPGDPKEWLPKVDRALELANKYDIIMIGSFIVGGPTETAKEMQTTVDYLRTSKVDIVQPFAFQYVIGSEFWHEAVDSGQLKPDDIYAYNDKKYGTSPYTAKELFDKVLEAEDLINSPILNPGRYVRLVGKFVKQKKWRVIWKNILQLPKIIQGLLLEHPYDIVIEDELND